MTHTNNTTALIKRFRENAIIVERGGKPYLFKGKIGKVQLEQIETFIIEEWEKLSPLPATAPANGEEWLIGADLGYDKDKSVEVYGRKKEDGSIEITNIKDVPNGEEWRLTPEFNQALGEMLRTGRSISVIDWISTNKLKWEEAVAKAYGGCTNCYGKGYATYRSGTRSEADFPGDKAYVNEPTTNYIPCDKCERGKQFEEVLASIAEGGKAE
jgi:hypothetical protein